MVTHPPISSAFKRVRTALRGLLSSEELFRLCTVLFYFLRFSAMAVLSGELVKVPPIMLRSRFRPVNPHSNYGNLRNLVNNYGKV